MDSQKKFRSPDDLINEDVSFQHSANSILFALGLYEFDY